MAKWGEIKCPRCAGLKDRLNYAVGEREDYEKIIKQLQAEWLANRVAIMRLEAKLAKAVAAERERCAKVAEGETAGPYFRLPAFHGAEGCASDESEVAQVARAIAAAIRKGGE